MKSFSQFIIEKKGNIPLNPDEKAVERSIIKNFNKRKKLQAGNTPSKDFSNTPTNPTSAPKNSNKVNPNNRPPTFAEVEASATQTPQGRKAQSDAIKGGANNMSSTANQKNGVLNKLKNGADKGRKRSVDGFKNLLDKVKGKGDARVPDPKKGELGKLYKSNDRIADPNRAGSVRTTDKINQELTAKRAARINPKTGKATKKGVENFAINQQTKGLSAKGDAGKQAMANAKKIAGNARSKAYKDIANKINTSDYAGKRAKLASTKELDKIAKSIKTSKTINTAVDIGKASKAPTAFSRSLSPSKTSLNTATRKGKIAKTDKPLYKASDSSKKTFSQFKSISGQKSNAAKLKIKPGKLLGKGFAAWNAIDNYNAAKGSPLRKLAKSAVTTAAYYKGGTAGATLGTGFGAITGPGAVVTGTAGFFAGSETASNLASRTFNKVWKPPTTKKNKKVAGTGGGTGDKGFRWKSGIAFESGKK